MNSIVTDIQSLGGLASTNELIHRGHSQMMIRGAVGRKAVVRVRKGWYCLPTLGRSFQAAARVGGRLTCVSLAESLGLWIPPGTHGLHVAVAPNAAQLRSTANYHDRLRTSNSDGVVVHWNDDGSGDSRVMTTLPSALERIAQCLEPESAMVVVESALNRRGVSAEQWANVLAVIPDKARRHLLGANSLADSGTESMFRFRSAAFGVRVRQQVQLGPDRVDFLLGDRLIIEIDSVAHHDPTEDAKRDARLSVLGYRVLRFMYSQIIHDWARVEAAIFAAIGRGDHLPA